jgi:two-component system response regulator HydG
MKKRILIVNDEEALLVQLKDVLKGMGMDIYTAQNGIEALHKLAERNFNIVLADLKMPKMDGLQLLENIKKSYPNTYVVIMSDFGQIPQAVKAMKLGAYDFIQKPFDIDLLRLSLKKLLQTQDIIEENISLRKEVEEKYDFHHIVGKNYKMRKIYELITLAAEKDTTTLIWGETGTGKELIAKAIHYHSPRKKKSLIIVNCPAIPESLLESELFGHEKGSFTGAHTQRIGRFELAHQGTILLDEIGDFPLSMQGKLLRFLQDKEIRRVGGRDTLNLDVRILLATNRNLEELVSQGKFREDLYYRVNVLSISIPPLRERVDDIPLLAEHFLKKYAGLHNREENNISADAMNSLIQYPWPGNVRELENVIEKAVLLNKGETIDRFDLSILQKIPLYFGEADMYMPVETDLPYKEIKERLLNNWEREYLKGVLSKNSGNITQAAKQAGLNYKTFYEKLLKHSIDRKQFKK